MAEPTSSKVTPLNSNRDSRTMSSSSLHSTYLRRESDVPFVATGDGVSDYQQYLEKTSNPRPSSLLASPIEAVAQPSEHGEDSIANSRFDMAMTKKQEARPTKVFESIKTKHRKQKRKPHRVEFAEDPQEYPGPIPLALLTVGICLSVFLVSLDRTIVATAIPRITDDFHSYDDVGWYGSAYLITAGALQPIYGRVFMLFNVKWSFLASLGIFELGSLICGIAPNSPVLIVGRAIAGFGSAGILTGSFVVVAHAVPLVKRPVYTASVGVMFGLGAIVGPLLGGAFTELATWRCFYFNLPVGGATIIAMLFCFKPHKDAPESDKNFLKKVLGLDLIGNFILIVAAVMLFLALQLQENGSAWGSARIIGLLIGVGITAIIFVLWQCKKGDEALLPGKIIAQRSVAVSAIAAFFIYGTILIHAYYLPIWFQAIKGANAVQSGIDLIPYMIANALFSVFAGITVSKVGYFAPPAIVGCAIGAVGCGLLSTLQVDSSVGHWIGYQIVTSAGLGSAVQQGIIAVQTVLRLDEVPIGVAAIVSMQSLGGAIFVSVGNSVLQNRLIQASTTNQLPDVDVAKVIAAGATQFRSMVAADALPALLVVYNDAVTRVFVAAIPLSALAFVAALGLEWRSVKMKKKTSPDAAIASNTMTDYGIFKSIEASRSRRRSEKSNGTTGSGTSFMTARTSVQV